MVKGLFDTGEIRERAKYIEFCDELSEQISINSGVDIDKASITKVRNVDLNLADPEVGGIVEERLKKT